MEDEKNTEKVEEKLYFLKDKKNIAIFILSIVLFISICSNLFSSKGTQIKEKYEENEAIMNNLIAEKDMLIKENENKITSLRDDNKILREEKQKLEEEKKSLEEEKTTLNSKIQELEKISSTKTQSQNTSSKTASVPNNTQKTTATSTQNTNSAIVYVTQTGKKYHKSGCSYLKKSKIQKTLSEVQSQGYTPCSKCY